MKTKNLFSFFLFLSIGILTTAVSIAFEGLALAPFGGTGIIAFGISTTHALWGAVACLETLKFGLYLSGSSHLVFRAVAILISALATFILLVNTMSNPKGAINELRQDYERQRADIIAERDHWVSHYTQEMKTEMSNKDRYGNFEGRRYKEFKRLRAEAIALADRKRAQAEEQFTARKRELLSTSSLGPDLQHPAIQRLVALLGSMIPLVDKKPEQVFTVIVVAFAAVFSFAVELTQNLSLVSAGKAWSGKGKGEREETSHNETDPHADEKPPWFKPEPEKPPGSLPPVSPW